MNVFSLSATLALDVSPFTQAVRQAESAAAALEGAVASRLSAATAQLRSLQSVAAEAEAAARRTAAAQSAASASSAAASSSPTRRASARSLVISLDGERVGALVASAVSDALTRQARERRYELP